MKRHVRANWSEAVLVCAKCDKKLKGGFGAKGKQTLATALKACAGGKGRKARFGVVPVSCLKICPKGAVTVVRGSVPGDWQIVEAGTPILAAMARLGLDGRSIADRERLRRPAPAGPLPSELPRLDRAG